MQTDIFTTGFETAAISMQPFWRLRSAGPLEDIDRVFGEIIKLTPLEYGKTDRNGRRSDGGFEYYRPMEGTPTGSEQDTRKRPDISEISIYLPRDEELVKRVIETIYHFHGYYEPPISLEPVLRSATKGLDDSNNPHRWWNKGGDWKTSTV